LEMPRSFGWSGLCARLGPYIVSGLVLTSAAFANGTAVTKLFEEADRRIEAQEASIESLRAAVLLYEEAARIEPTNVEVHVRLADAALSLGDAPDGDPLVWYERGLKAAERAVALDDHHAHAHFLIAAHRGHIARQRKLESPLVVRDLENRLRRVLALNPSHAPALNMTAMLLRDTPALLRPLLRGSQLDVERYLVAAVKANPNFSEARLNLAEHYRSIGKITEARMEAEAIVRMTHPTQLRRWRTKDRRAAEELLRELRAK